MNLKGIKYVGPIFDSSGYAQAARGYILSLHRLGIPITIKSVSFEEGMSDLGRDGVVLSSLVNKNIDYNVVIIHLTVEHYEKFCELGKVNIGYSVWETDRIHPQWVEWLNDSVDAVLTASDWGVDSYKKSGVKVPIFSVPHGIDLDEYKDVEPYELKGVDPNAYKFYAIFQFIERKNPLALIKSYWHAFQNDENVALILKTYRFGFSDTEKQQVRDTLSRLRQVMPMDKYPPIYLILDMLDRSEVLGLHKSCNCLTHLDRGEGFGLCVSPDTKILLEDGVKLAKDVLNGDFVLSIDGEFHKVTDVNSRYVDNGIRIKSLLHEDIIVSSDHPFYTLKNLTKWKRYNWTTEHIEEKLEWVKSEDIKVGDYLALPKPSLNDRIVGTDLYIDDFVSLDDMVVEDDVVYLKNGYSPKNTNLSYKNLVNTYGYTKKIFESAVKHLKNKTIPSKGSKVFEAFNILLATEYICKKPNSILRKIKITDEILNLFGWYIAEGSSNNNTCVEFDCNINEYKILERIASVFKHDFGVNGGSIFLQKYDNKSRLIISSKILATLFSNLFGSGASNKQIPKVLFNSGKHLKPLLKGLFAGDGHDDGTVYALTTTSFVLAYQVKSIFNSLGCCPRISNKGVQNTGNFSQYVVSVSNEDYEYFTDKNLVTNTKKYFVQTENFFLVKVTNVQSINHNDFMYDFSVENASSFVGNGLLLHNCPFEAGAIGNPIMVTGWGGTLAYAKPENSYLINYTLTPVFGMPISPFYRGDQLWAEPDLWHAVKTFRYIYENQSEAANKGRVLKNYIADNFSWDQMGMRIIEVIKSL